MKKTVLTLLAVAALGVISTVANAVTSMGVRPCGTWIENRRIPNSNGDVAAQGWLAGYLTGMAVASGRDALVNADLPSMSLWIDNYCRQNPLKRLDDAGVALFFELKPPNGSK